MRLNSAPARQRFNEGVRDGLPLAIGALPWGLTFGLLVAQLGLRPLDTWLQTLLMSAWWFSGTAQFVALGLWQPPISVATLGALALAVFGVNARYLLQSTVLAPWPRKLSRGGEENRALASVTLR